MQRAFLMGIASYKDPSIKDLPFLGNDLRKLRSSLEGRGFEVSAADSSAPTRNEVIAAVEAFIADGCPGDTLVVYLAGHGAHASGVDYLIPSDAVQRVRDLGDACVSVDKWAPVISTTRAATVVIFIDACREGFEEVKVLSTLGRRRRWSSGRIALATERRWAYVFSCGAGQYSHYVTDPASQSMTAFSAALCATLREEDCPGDVRGVVARAQDKLDDLVREHKRHPQTITVRSERDASTITLVPGLAHAPPPSPSEAASAGPEKLTSVVRDTAYAAWGFAAGLILGRDQGNL